MSVIGAVGVSQLILIQVSTFFYLDMGELIDNKGKTG